MANLLLIGQKVRELHPAMPARLRVGNLARFEQFHQSRSGHPEEIGGFLRRQDDTLRLESDGLAFDERMGCMNQHITQFGRKGKRLAIGRFDNQRRSRLQGDEQRGETPVGVGWKDSVLSSCSHTTMVNRKKRKRTRVATGRDSDKYRRRVRRTL